MSCLTVTFLPKKIVETFLRPLSSSLPTPVAHGNQYFFTNTNDIRKLSNDQSQVQILYTDSDHPQVMSSFKDLLYRNRTSSSSRFDLYTHVSRVKNHFCLFPCICPLSLLPSCSSLPSLSPPSLPPSLFLPLPQALDFNSCKGSLGIYWISLLDGRIHRGNPDGGGQAEYVSSIFASFFWLLLRLKKCIRHEMRKKNQKPVQLCSDLSQ